MLPMVRGLFFVALVVFTFYGSVGLAQVLSAADMQAMRSALAAAQSGDWSRAYTEVAAITDPLPPKMLRWVDYARPGSPGRFPEIAEFIERTPIGRAKGRCASMPKRR